MSNESVRVTTPSEREIELTRVFDAPRQLVFDAYTKPELVKRWLGVRAGWTLPHCEIDLRVGGTARYVWRHEQGREMGMTSVFRELVVPERIVAVERFDDAWYPGEAVGTITFVEHEGRTTLTMTLAYDSKQTRDMVLQSGATTGIGEGFDALASLLRHG